MFDSLKVGCVVMISRTLHGFRGITEDYTGEVLSLGREGDEQFAVLKLKGGPCKFWECEAERIKIQA